MEAEKQQKAAQEKASQGASARPKVRYQASD